MAECDVRPWTEIVVSVEGAAIVTWVNNLADGANSEQKSCREFVKHFIIKIF